MNARSDNPVRSILAVIGALVMLAFGLGTLPNLLLLGYFAARLRPWLQRRGVRLAAGLLVRIRHG